MAGPLLDRAAFVVSIDTEMAWGLLHRPEIDYRYERERDHLGRLIDLFDAYDVGATWAVVGHLMLDGCSPENGVKHPEIVRPGYPWLTGDWFDADPACEADDAPTWYAPDLVDAIRSAAADHEIASHGFSHMMAGEAGCTRAAFESELRAAVTTAADRDLTLRSFVYPRNQIGHTDVLRQHGIAAYRGARPGTGLGPRSPLERATDIVIGSERTTVRPVDEDGLWNFPATIMFDVARRHRWWRLWIGQVIRRLDQAVANRSLFHLWFHPDNLRDRPDASFAGLERIVAAAAKHRDRGDLDTVTMGALACSMSSS